MSIERWAEAVWYGTHPGATVTRAALLPLSAAFGLVARARGRLYDAGILRRHALPLPALSVGNLTVGGTGKTPVAAWVVAQLAARGTHPAVVLRGVGDDEARVHALLNPGAPVVTDRDRVRGAFAAARRGADVLVLDDAFQHRRAARDADLVLIATETFGAHARLLPAGPYREPLSALRRASLVLVTRKSATAAHAAEVAGRVAALLVAGPGDPVDVAVAHLAPAAVVRWPRVGAGGSPEAALETLAGARVLAVAGIGAPSAFVAQLRALGASVVLARFPDHHAYDERTVAGLAERARAADLVVTTLKDAVKLGPRWPRHAGALWYVTQRVTVEAGAAALTDMLDAIATDALATAARAGAARLPHRTAPDSAAPGRHA